MENLEFYPLTILLKALSVSRSGFYAWRTRLEKSLRLQQAIKEEFMRHDGKVGAPSIVHDVRERGFDVSERTVGRHMQGANLRCKIARKFKVTTDSDHRIIKLTGKPFPSLLENWVTREQYNRGYN